jgi:hypothetical protein
MPENAEKNEERVQNSPKFDNAVESPSKNNFLHDREDCATKSFRHPEAFVCPEWGQPIVICIPLQSWSFSSFDRVSNFGIGGNLTANSNISSLPLPKQNAILFESFLAPPIERTQKDWESLAKQNSVESNQVRSHPEVRLVKQSTYHNTALAASVDKKSSEDLTRYNPEDLSKTELPTNGDRNSRNHLDKILLAIACCYSLVIFYCLAGKLDFKLVQLFAPQTAKIPSTGNSPDPNAQFVSYMKQSLEAIERKAKTQQQQTTVSSTNSDSKPTTITNSITNVPIAVNTVTTPTIPPWQTATALPIGAGLPTTSATTNSMLTQIPDFSPPPPPPPVQKPIAPKKSSKLPPPPVSQYEPNSLPTPEEPPRVAVSQPTAAGYTLIGLLDLGQKSAALFENNDTTKQIWSGETIGDTGWILKTVSDRAVTIVRHGEVRSVSVGERF